MRNNTISGKIHTVGEIAGGVIAFQEYGRRGVIPGTAKRRKGCDMCANGVNTEQYKMMIDYMDDTLAVNRRWIHKMAHTVEDNGYAKTSEVMHQVQALLDDARALLTDAKDAIEDDDEKLGGVTVSLV